MLFTGVDGSLGSKPTPWPHACRVGYGVRASSWMIIDIAERFAYVLAAERAAQIGIEAALACGMAHIGLRDLRGVWSVETGEWELLEIRHDSCHA